MLGAALAGDLVGHQAQQGEGLVQAPAARHLALHQFHQADALVRGIRSGLVKVNVSTHLNGGFTGAVRAYLSDHPAIVDSRKYVSAGRAVVRDEAARLLALFASAGTVHEKEPA